MFIGARAAVYVSASAAEQMAALRGGGPGVDQWNQKWNQKQTISDPGAT